MSGKLKKIFLFLVAFAVINYNIFICTSKIYAASFELIEAIKKNYISEDMAYNIAQSFIVNSVDNGVAENWNEYAEAQLLSECYDTNGNISAYVYNITDTYSNEKCGYIVIGGSRVYSPVIEFSENEDFTYVNYLCANDILIYEGGIDYYGYSDESVRYYYCDSNQAEVLVENINKCFTVSEEIEIQWDNISKIADGQAENILIDGVEEAYYGSSSEPLGSVGTDKREGETGEDSIKLSNLPSTFYLMSKFVNLAESDTTFDCTTECCSPTAAINLLYYYYNRSSTYYSTLDVGNNVYSRFKLMYSLMKTNDSGTWDTNLVNGLTQFLNNYTRFKHSVVTNRDLVALDATEMIADLKANKPVILNTKNHDYYGNHSMVCVGIRTYSSGSIYYAVADGHTTIIRYMDCYAGNAAYTSAITVHLYK